MRKILLYCLSALCLFFVAAIPSIAGPCSPDSNEAPTIYVPDRSCLDFGYGYQYQHYNDVYGRSFADNGFNLDFGMHLFDPLTGAVGRMTAGLEATSAFGFGSTGGNPNLSAKSLFVGAGPHIAIQSHSRLEPWVHGLVGLEHFRFTQTAKFGSQNSVGFMLGGGLDVRVDRGLYWRVQGDYVGTNFQSTLQSNYSVGTGFLFYF
jgi:hypothetical protein